MNSCRLMVILDEEIYNRLNYNDLSFILHDNTAYVIVQNIGAASLKAEKQSTMEIPPPIKKTIWFV